MGRQEGKVLEDRTNGNTVHSSFYLQYCFSFKIVRIKTLMRRVRMKNLRSRSRQLCFHQNNKTDSVNSVFTSFIATTRSPHIQYLYIEWCTSSRTTTILHMVRLGDAPVYYQCIILLIWNILTRTTEVMWREQTRGKCVM